MILATPDFGSSAGMRWSGVVFGPDGRVTGTHGN
jgi:hypothetical protein